VGAIGNNDDRERAESAITDLIGRSVVGWQLNGARVLRVEFTGSRTLEVQPPEELVPDLDEWWFCLPGSRFVGVSGTGQIVAGDSGYAADRGAADFSHPA
jgi:hypothetical protein